MLPHEKLLIARTTINHLKLIVTSAYVDFINEYLKVPVKYVSNGPGRDQLITLNEN